MIDRLFDFCFGSQRHKYATLGLAMVGSLAGTLMLVGAEAAPRMAPIVAIVTFILAVPIGWVLRGIEAEATDLAWSRRLARRAARRFSIGAMVGLDNELLGDLEEYRTELAERFGRRRANAWYRFQALAVLLHGSRLAAAVRLRYVVVLALAIEASIVLTTHNELRPTPFALLVEMFHTIAIVMMTSIGVLAWAEHIDHDFERFRSEKRSRAEKS